MEKLSRDAVQRLLANNTQPEVTIYAPMIPTAAPPHISENQIRLKNLVHEAASELDKHGEQHELSKKLLDLYDQVYDDLTFWENQTPGLLICANANEIAMFNLPIDTEEYVSVDDQFHLAPILGLLADANEFYVLTIAQQAPCLYKGDMYGMKPADIKLPQSVNEALNIDESNQKTENQGTAAGPSTQGAASSPSSGRGWFNGRGGARNPQEADREKFFRFIDNAIINKVDRSLPIILAGVDSEIAEFRSISHLPNLLDGTLPINNRGVNLEQLFEQAQAIIRKEITEPAHAAAVEEYTRLSGANPERVASDHKSITTAAEQGRVDKLLASIYRDTSDNVSDSMEDVLRITFPEPTSSKLLNRLALKVWQMSGKIINVLPNQIPNNQLMVARLRY